MSKWLALLLALYSLLIFVTVAIAQTATTSFEPSPHIYKIVADCPDLSNQRIATGFRVKGQVGIVTALHAIAGCSKLTAQRASNGPGPFQNLIVAKVDIARDVALLWSEDLSKISTDGFEAISKPQDSDYRQVKVIGYPYDLYRQKLTIDIKVVETTELGNLIFPELNQIFTDRGSPDVGIQVLGLQGTLVPGHSGAPLLNSENKVVGIADGGLDLGRTDMTWAIPWHMIDWKAVSTQIGEKVSENDVRQLENLGKLPPDLFTNESAETTTPTIVPPVATATILPPVSNVVADSLVRHQYDAIDASTDAVKARNAFDRNTTTPWAPYNKSLGEWIEVRFRNPKTVYRVGIFRNPTQIMAGQITRFTLTFSDGSRQTASIQGFNEWEYVDIQPVQTTSVKLEVESTYPASNNVFVYEIELLGTDSPSPTKAVETPRSVALPASSPYRLQYDGLKVSDEYVVKPAANAFDRNLNTNWLSYNKSVGVWVELLFRNPKTVSQIRIYRGPEMITWGQIQQATLVFSDGSRQSVSLQGFDGWEQVDIRPILTTSVKLEVDAVHLATKKLVVYEIEIWGTDQ